MDARQDKRRCTALECPGTDSRDLEGSTKGCTLSVMGMGKPPICAKHWWWCMVEKIPRQGRLEGCHRMSAATDLIYGLESMK